MKETLKRITILLLLLIIIILGVILIIKVDKRNKEEKIITKTIDNVTYELQNENLLEYNVKNVKLSTNQIEVKGKKKEVDKITKIVAIIDVNKYDIDSLGEHNINGIPIYNLDNKRRVIDTVETKINNISATLKLEEYVKKVPVYIDCKAREGQTTTFQKISIDGKDIKDYKITLIGKKSETNLHSFVVEFQGIPKELYPNDEYTFELTKADYPAIKELVKMDLKIGTAKVKRIKITSTDFKDVKKGLDAEGLVENGEIFVDLYGPAEAVEQVDDTDPKDIKAYFDVENLNEGEYKLPLKLLINDRRIQYRIISGDVLVRVFKK